MELLPDFLSILRRPGASSELLGHTLRKLADAVGRVSTAEAQELVGKMEESGALASVVLACASLPIDQAHTEALAGGIVVLGNTACLGGVEAVVDAGGVEYLVSLLSASGDAEPPMMIKRQAVAALSHLVSDKYGCRAVRASEREKLLAQLVVLSNDPAAHSYAHKAISGLRRVRGAGGSVWIGDRKKAEARAQARIAATKEAALRRADREADRAYLWAAKQLQSQLRLRRDARQGAVELRNQHKVRDSCAFNPMSAQPQAVCPPACPPARTLACLLPRLQAATVIARTMRGRMARLQLQFGNRMRELRNHRITMQEQITREMEEEGNVGIDDFLLDALESVVDTAADTLKDQATVAMKLSKATKSKLDITEMFDDNSPAAKKRRKGNKKPSIGE